MVAAGIYPSPIGIADVVTSTTHKTFCGPRGAIIMTTKPLLSRKIDRAVFPGEQGGPHVNHFAALAIAAKLARLSNAQCRNPRPMALSRTQGSSPAASAAVRVARRRAA